MQYDVVVCGGGPSGVAAAVAAGRAGARTLLTERYGFCGGMATGGLVNPWAGHEYREPSTDRYGSLSGGLFKEVVARLADAGGYGSALTASAFDEERLKFVYDTMLAEAGVDVLYHTVVTGAEVTDGTIATIAIHSKDGHGTLAARAFIDATGDGDLADRAGCDWTLGRDSDRLTQAMTVSFRIANVDKAAMVAELRAAGKTGHKNARALVEPYFQAALRSGRLVYPYRDWMHFYDYPHPGVLHFNMTRINEVNGLSAADLTRAEIEGRRQAFLLADWLRRDVPYFRESYLEKVACQVGVRETRHVRGLYTMTKDDIVAARKFPDGIARSRYFIDIHSPKGAGFDHEVANGLGAVRSSFSVPPGDYYEIPYRAVVPAGVANLLVPCRALSASHEAAAAVRVMANMTAIGEAAGIAAGLLVAGNAVSFADVDGRAVRAAVGYLDRGPEFGAPWVGTLAWENENSIGAGTCV